jgi:hypothetical protein
LSNAHLSKRWPLCLDLAPYCKSGDLLAAITASILQANGTAQNPYLDPVTLRPLVDGPEAAGFRRALQIHRALAALATPDVPGLENVTLLSCAVISRAFQLGSCAMTIDWEAVITWGEWDLHCLAMSHEPLPPSFHYALICLLMRTLIFCSPHCSKLTLCCCAKH